MELGTTRDLNLETKRAKRLQNKKRKATALLAVSELNDSEKADKKRKRGNDDENNEGKHLLVTEEKLISFRAPTELQLQKPLLEGEEYEELKKRLRERKKALTCTPLFRLKAVGEEAGLDRQARVPLFMSDIQHLLTFAMVGDRSPHWPHRWAALSKWNRLANVVCLVVEGVGAADCQAAREGALAWPAGRLAPLMEVVSPASYGSSMAEELALMPLTVRHKKKLIEEYGSLENSLEKGEAFKAFRSIFPVQVPAQKGEAKSDGPEGLRLKLLLSASQMVTENYPLPLKGALEERFRDFKPTSASYIEVSAGSPLFSVDCEMCMTDLGSELTRICVVDQTLTVVYHSLVLPDQPIRNYLTRHSGITAEMLEGVTTRLEDVQAALQKIIPPDAILVGQSLNCDLAAMKMMHPYVIDTSVCFNITGDRRRKSKLSLLAHLFLNMRIQTAGKHGHSPIEDAQTAMKLINLKLEKGLAFGDVVLGGQVPVMDEGGVYTVPGAEENKKNIKNDWKHENLMTSISKTLADHEKTVALITDVASHQSYNEFAGFHRELKLTRTLDTAREAVVAATTAALDHNLTICHVELGEHEDRLALTSEAAEKLFNFTSINGMFVMVLAGTEAQNAVAGVVIRKPEVERL